MQQRLGMQILLGKISKKFNSCYPFVYSQKNFFSCNFWFFAIHCCEFRTVRYDNRGVKDYLNVVLISVSKGFGITITMLLSLKKGPISVPVFIEMSKGWSHSLTFDAIGYFFEKCVNLTDRSNQLQLCAHSSNYFMIYYCLSIFSRISNR